MNSNGHSDPSGQHVASGKSKKNRKRKNKGSTVKTNGDHSPLNGPDLHQELETAASDDELGSAEEESQQAASSRVVPGEESLQEEKPSRATNGRIELSNGSIAVAGSTSAFAAHERLDGSGEDHTDDSAAMLRDAERRLEAAAQERDQLRLEVTGLRVSLEEVQRDHDREISRLRADLDETHSNTHQLHVNEITGLQQQLEKVNLSTQESHKEAAIRAEVQIQEAQSQAQREHEQDLARLRAEFEETETRSRQLHNEAMSSLRQSQQEAAFSTQEKHEEEISGLRTKLEEHRLDVQLNNEQISVFRSGIEQAQYETKQQHDEEISRLELELKDTKTSSRKQAEEDISRIEAQFQETLSNVERQHDEIISQMKEEITQARSSVVQQHDEEVSTLKAQFGEAQYNIEKQHNEELSSLKSQLSEAQSSINQQHEIEITSLRAQVLEAQSSAQQQLDDETSDLKTQLEEAKLGKEHAESQYSKLLGKVNTIKSQLGERLKADAAELALARTQIEELEERARITVDENQSLQAQLTQFSAEKEQHLLELSNLRSRSNLSQQNWAKERDDLLSTEAQIREEFESAKQAMQDWEVLAMEERSIREGLGDRVAELEDQLSSHREAYERASSERDTQSVTVDGLQRALRDVQEARKVELREMVESTQAQLEEIRKQLKVAEESSIASQKELETVKEEFQRVLPFEKEVKEKNLLIGKLRHEAVILNDHLTKALRFLKRGKTADTVDRQLVTNHVLQFLALDRADPKKFQVLQLISAILGWTEEQNEQAGLARPGASSQPINPNSSLRTPMSPFLRRVSSGAPLNSPAHLNSVFNSTPAFGSTSENAIDSPSGKETLADLWSSFLEREAASRDDGQNHSRQSSGMGGPVNRRDTLGSPTSGTSTPRQYGY